MFDNHHHGADHIAVWLPMPHGAQETLIEADPDRYFRPPYVGPSGWVGVVLDVSPAAPARFETCARLRRVNGCCSWRGLNR